MDVSDRPWQFSAPTAVRFGRGVRRDLGTVATGLGRHALVVTGGQHLADSGELDSVRKRLRDAHIASTIATIAHEPNDSDIDAMARTGRSCDCDLVIAIGGGSALDAGKAAAALITNDGACVDYLEGISERTQRTLNHDPLPVIAIPTTAGTGSEVTKNAVIQVNKQHVKRSLRDHRLIPRHALVDPELLSSCPMRVAAAAGLDAFAHNLESFLSTGASPITDDMATDGMQRALHFLRELANDGVATATAWDGMALAALTGGWCLANARLGAAHGLVAPLGGRFEIPHAIGVACLTAPTLIVTDRVLHERAIDHPSRMRLHEVAGLIAGRGSSTIEAAEVIDALRRDLEIPTLRSFGVDHDAIPAIAGSPSSSIKSHPVELSRAECEEILQRAL